MFCVSTMNVGAASRAYCEWSQVLLCLLSFSLDVVTMYPSWCTPHGVPLMAADTHVHYTEAWLCMFIVGCRLSTFGHIILVATALFCFCFVFAVFSSQFPTLSVFSSPTQQQQKITHNLWGTAFSGFLNCKFCCTCNVVNNVLEKCRCNVLLIKYYMYAIKSEVVFIEVLILPCTRKYFCLEEILIVQA